MRRVVDLVVRRFPVGRSGPYGESEDELLEIADAIRFEFWLAVRAITGRFDGQPGWSEGESASDNELRPPLHLRGEQMAEERLPFETLIPEAEAVTIAEAARFLGYSRAEGYELAKAGGFPVPFATTAREDLSPRSIWLHIPDVPQRKPCRPASGEGSGGRKTPTAGKARSPS